MTSARSRFETVILYGTKNSAPKKMEAKWLEKTSSFSSRGQKRKAQVCRQRRLRSGGLLLALFLLEVAVENNKT